MIDVEGFIIFQIANDLFFGKIDEDSIFLTLVSVNCEYSHTVVIAFFILVLH